MTLHTRQTHDAAAWTSISDRGPQPWRINGHQVVSLEDGGVFRSYQCQRCLFTRQSRMEFNDLACTGEMDA